MHCYSVGIDLIKLIKSRRRRPYVRRQRLSVRRRRPYVRRRRLSVCRRRLSVRRQRQSVCRRCLYVRRRRPPVRRRRPSVRRRRSSVRHQRLSERSGSVVVSTSAWHAAGRWFDYRARHVSLLGVKTWLSTGIVDL